ncbi:hypothetical protein PSZ99_23695, partial [Shigella sonnei]|nr:hypothetical protein [Shigella sonnei]
MELQLLAYARATATWDHAISYLTDHTKGSKSDRKRQIPCDIIYLWNLKYDTNEPIYETESQTQRNRLVVARGDV